MKKGTLSAKRAIFWYTNTDGVYKIMNNILRSGSHPSEIFFIQPFFKDLFITIKNLQNQQSKKKDFVCFRGGSLFKN